MRRYPLSPASGGAMISEVIYKIPPACGGVGGVSILRARTLVPSR